MKKAKRLILLLVMFAMALCVFVGCDDGEPNKSNISVDSSANKDTSIDVSVLPTDEVTNAVVNLIDNIDSVHIEEDMIIDVTANGINMSVTGKANADISESQGMGHYYATVSTNGMSVEAEMYTENFGDSSNVYIGNNGNWVQFNVKNVDMIEYTGEYVDVEHVKLFLNSLIDIERSSTTINGKSAILLEGEVDFSKLDEVVKALGFGDMLATGNISAEQIEQMYEGIASPKMFVYLDNATGLPLQIDVDVVDFYKSFFSNANRLIGGSMNMDVNHANISIKFSNYNGASVSIPDEVRNSSKMN